MQQFFQIINIVALIIEQTLKDYGLEMQAIFGIG